VVQSLHARWQFLIVAFLAAVACACVLFASLPMFGASEHGHACVQNDTSSQHSGAESHDLLAVDDDEPEDEELSTTAGAIPLFGPRAPSRILATACLAPRLPPQTQLERPPRA
jgi:hypothetical protein